MTTASLLSVDEVREYLSDYPSENLLLDKEEFSNTFITLCMSLAVNEYNSISPRSGNTEANFPSKSVLLFGTLWQMYNGRAALLARNHLSYSDGGLSIPVEERYELYRSLADTFKSQFLDTSIRLKAAMNMEAGWGEVRSDEAIFPIY